MIAANPVNDGLGFDRDDNSLQVFWSEGEKSFPVAPKKALGRDLIALIAERLDAIAT
jgi:phosphopantothenoylcysteine decarboxylase/phosphopantothenate--cysteine ligase